MMITLYVCKKYCIKCLLAELPFFKFFFVNHKHTLLLIVERDSCSK